MRGKSVSLDSVSMRFGDFTAVQPTTLTIQAGEFFSILGPSGCGKTTLLRMISGFMTPTGGTIRIGDADVTALGPNRRPTALIFQNLALFPLMPVWENVAFGLEVRGVSKRQRREKAEELLALVALDGQGDKLPTALSGGQRQRVAIARALAVEPAVLLLDEPLSALDLKLRQHMRTELKEIQRKTGVTFLYITHDQGEALTMSDRVAVMRSGIVEQVGRGDDIYDNPATSFVASFVGESNRLSGTVEAISGGQASIATRFGTLQARCGAGLTAGEKAIVFIRPERTRLQGTPDGSGFALRGTFLRRDLEGPFVNLFFDCQGLPVTVHVTNDSRHASDSAAERWLCIAPEDALALPAGALARDE